MLSNSSILITGGTGSFGSAFVPMTLKKYNPKKIVIFSRDEMKQWEMAKLYKDFPNILSILSSELAHIVDWCEYKPSDYL